MSYSAPASSSSPATKHIALAVQADAAAAQAAGNVYRALYFGAAGVASIVDLFGHAESVTVVAGTVYPLVNLGLITSGTTVAVGSVMGLYD